MKKNYFMLAATTMMLAACAQTDLVNEIAVEETPQAIGFETFANKATRAENSDETKTDGLGTHHSDFNVWGYKDTYTQYVFNNEKVYLNGSTWKYDGAKYWDKAANKYEFYAAAPYNTKWKLIQVPDANQASDYFVYENFELLNTTIQSTKYVESFQGVNTQDLMIASPESVEESAILSVATVELDFNHILSRLNVTVKKSANLVNEPVNLTSISINKLFNIGTFNENDKEGHRWTLTENVGSITGQALSGVGSSESYVIQSLVMPQDVKYAAIDRNGKDNNTTAEAYLYITYTIGNEPFKVSYNLANAFGKTKDEEYVAFKEGWQNTLNITIDADAIEFDAVTFKWDEHVKTENVPVIGTETENTK